MKKTIITVATTGAWPKKENNPNVPMTPAEIAEDVYACWKAGAAVAHEAALQISAMGAQWLTREDVPAEVVESERRVATEKSLAEGKPEKI